MISNTKEAIATKLLELYSTAKIYDEDVPQSFKTPCFVVSLINQDYNKRFNVKYRSQMSFDVAYFSKKAKTEIKNDCQAVQLNLLRSFDLISNYKTLVDPVTKKETTVLVGNYRTQNKQATIVDNVLHFTFDVPYSELKEGPFTAMETQNTNTIQKG